MLGISVGKAWRGRGVGSALMQDFLDWATENESVEKVRQEAVAGNQRALRLHHPLGSREEGSLPRKTRRDDGTDLDSILMIRFATSMREKHTVSKNSTGRSNLSPTKQQIDPDGASKERGS